MGVTLRIDMAPVQLDVLMRSVNAIKEMLLSAPEYCLSLLPACLERFESGEVMNRRFPGGRISFRWNRGKMTISSTHTAGMLHGDIVVKLPDWTGKTATLLHVDSETAIDF